MPARNRICGLAVPSQINDRKLVVHRFLAADFCQRLMCFVLTRTHIINLPFSQVHHHAKSTAAALYFSSGSRCNAAELGECLFHQRLYYGYGRAHSCVVFILLSASILETPKTNVGRLSISAGLQQRMRRSSLLRRTLHQGRAGRCDTGARLKK